MKPSMIAKIEAVVFDYDGLLGDTEGFFDRMVQAYAIHQIGQKLPPDVFRDVRIRMFGRKKEDSAQILYEALVKLGMPAEQTDPMDYLEWRQPRETAMFPETKLLPGAEGLIKHLRQHRVPMAIATSSTKEAFNLKISRCRELFAAFDGVVVTGDMVKQGKPDPESFLKAAELIGADPGATLVFEDAESGVRAGKNAGMYVVAVPHPWLNPEAVAAADQMLRSLNDFKPEQWGLPAYA